MNVMSQDAVCHIHSGECERRGDFSRITAEAVTTNLIRRFAQAACPLYNRQRLLASRSAL